MDRIQDFEVNSPRWLSLEDFDGEIWKDIPDYEGYYQVSNMGRIKSLDRYITYQRPRDCRPRTDFWKGTILKASWYGSYLICHLKKHGKSKAVKFHRVVCSVFHPNPDNLPEVNHINEIKTDNRADNLEWCTRQYNAKWGTAIDRDRIARINHPDLSVIVYQFTLDGKYVAKYPSAREAERVTGIKATNILSVCCNQKSSSTGDYIWSYTQDPTVIIQKVKRKANGLKRYGKRKVCQFTKEGDFLREYESLSAASKITGINRTVIQKVCAHVGCQKSAGGFKWEYSEN